MTSASAVATDTTAIGVCAARKSRWPARLDWMSQRLESWIRQQEGSPDLTRFEPRMEPALAEKIYEIDRCIEYGCRVAACGTARMREEFVGAVGLNKIARFRLDPRDTRSDEDFYEPVGEDKGVFGCMSLLGCDDVCPKKLPLATQLAFIRRKMVAIGWTWRSLRKCFQISKEGAARIPRRPCEGTP